MKLYIPDIPLIDFEAQAAVQKRLDRQIKPAGLGILEPLALRLALINGQTTLSFPRKTVFILCSDHGHKLGDSAETETHLQTLVEGNSAVNALSRQAGAPLMVVNLGLAGRFKHPNLEEYVVGKGSGDMTLGPALTLPETQDAMTVGMNLISMEIGRGMDIMVPAALATGANVSALAALAALVETDVADISTDPAAQAIAQAGLDLNRPNPKDVLEILSTLGGLELAGMVGLCLASAAGRVPILLDDFSSCVAALFAIHFNPAVRPYLIAGHRDGTAAHDFILRKLGQRPLLDLGVGHPAGLGASMAFHLIEAAARMVNETALAPESDAGISLDVTG